MKRLLLTFCLLLPAAGWSQDTSRSHQQTYRESIDAWHARRIEGLKREHGWLSLVALDWLKEGTNAVPGFGSLTLARGTASLQLSDSAKATVAGKPFTGGAIAVEGDSSAPDKVVSGSRAFVVIRRKGQFAIRMWDAKAETRASFSGIERYPVAEQWRITAQWKAYSTPKKVQVSTVIPGLTEEYLIPGAAEFTVGKRKYRLEPVVQKPGEDLFFIFGDRTNGKETYPAGRFMYSPPPFGGTVILDFNKAYNPPCAFTPYATCPLPPAGNKLAVRIEAGEKKSGNH